MIYTERKVFIKNDIATIDSPILLFRGDREIEILFTIVDSKFKFDSSKGNVIDKTQAAFGQLAVDLPDGTDLFTDIVECENGVVVFTITGDMIDEIHEVGFYSFHIRLYNDDKSSRITLPPIVKGIEIREPLIMESDVETTDLVGDATVGYSMLQTYGVDEEVFDEDGNYIPTVWGIGDKITASKLNKIEEALEIVNLDTTPDIVDSIEEMKNTNKQYVYSATNTLWKYKTYTVPVVNLIPDMNNAVNWPTTQVVINKRLNSTFAETDAPGCAIFYFTFDDEMKNILNTVDPVWIRLKGCSLYATSGNTTSTKVTTWKNDGSTGITATPGSQILVYEETEDGISDTPNPNNIFKYNDNKTAPVQATKFGYMNATVSDNTSNTIHFGYMFAVEGKLALSVIVNFASKTAITEEDIKYVYITFNEPIVSYDENIVGSWEDTGIVYDDGSAVANLGIRVSDLEDRVEELENGLDDEEDTSLPDYWKNHLVKIGEKIDSLQKENGMDTIQFLWCSDIHGVPGTSPSNTTYIGEIGRYVMDKHHIPFFVVSGDIMSQASHGNTTEIWKEYDKLTSMLSPINNEEFLAIRGNHDGVWGSPMEYNGQANQYYHSYIGDKALFNAFMRRQTLDSYRRVFDTSGMYFYVDYHNYRIYMLNSHTFGDDSVNAQGQAVYNGFKQCVFGSKQLQWIADTLMTVKENQQVIFMSHAPINYMKDIYVFAQMLIAYRERTDYTKTEDVSGTYWASGTEYSTSTVTKNFANAKGDFVGHFSGHIHKDIIEMLGYVPTFSITTAGGDVRDTYYTDGALTRTRGTATETAIDLVTITSDYVYFTRIGSGYDRKFNRLTNEVTIDTTPPVEEPEVELTQGEITNEVTWTMDKRLSSAGDPDKDNKGAMVSDYIAVNPGDVINIYGISSLDARSFYINFYKDEIFLYSIPLSNANYNPTDHTYAYAEYDADTLHLTVQIKDVQTVNSIRVCFVASTVEVYRNADKTEDTTNLAIPNATNTTDTSIWVNGYRFSSSGLAAEAGSSVSNKIPIQKGDIIKISGVTLRENADRLCVNVTRTDTGEDGDQLGYFNNGIVDVMSYTGCVDGVYTFIVEDEYDGPINYFRFAMPTPTDFSKVKVIREEGGNN